MTHHETIIYRIETRVRRKLLTGDVLLVPPDPANAGKSKPEDDALTTSHARDWPPRRLRRDSIQEAVTLTFRSLAIFSPTHKEKVKL